MFYHIRGTKRPETDISDDATPLPRSPSQTGATSKCTKNLSVINSPQCSTTIHPAKDTSPLKSLVIWNCRGLFPKCDHTKVPILAELFKLSKPQSAIIIESHLASDIMDSELAIENYDIYRADRDQRKCGGILNYVHESMNVSKLVSYSNKVCELLVIKAIDENCLVCAVYRPPKTAAADFIPIIDKLRSIIAMHENTDIVLAGDFNFPNICWSDVTCPKIAPTTKDDKLQIEALLNFTDDFFLQQLISKPTRENNTIDLLFTNITDDLYDCNITKYSASDHRMIEVNLIHPDPSISSPETEGESLKGFHSLNFHKANFQEINNDLSEVDWSLLLNNKSVSEQLSVFYDTTLKISKKHTSAKLNKTIKSRSKYYRERRALWRKRRRVQQKKDSENKDKLLEEIDTNIKKSHVAERLYIENQAIDKIAINSKYFFSYANKTRKSKDKIGPLIDKDTKEVIKDPKLIAEALQSQYCSVFSKPKASEKIDDINSFFNDNNTEDYLTNITFTPEDVENCIKSIKPQAAAGPDGFPAILLRECNHELSKALYLIFRNSIDNGDIPNELKDAIITPIPKGGLKSDPKNYRPINLLSKILIVLEKVISLKLVAYLENNHKMNINQHGFRRLHSCLSQLLLHYDSIIEAISSGCTVDVVYLDFCKAFDVVDHHILLRKMKKLGISGKIAIWIHNFITDRKQTVSVKRKLSSSQPVQSGVPQGSCLGPILFLIMISDIDDHVTKSTVSLFADDTKVSHILSVLQDCNDLQSSLNEIYSWSQENNMSFNDLKFHALRYGSGNEEVKNYKYKTPNGSEIPFETSIKDLGVNMSQNLLFRDHIQIIAARCRGLSAWILRTFVTREKIPMLTLFNSLILPRIDYCSQLWAPHHNQDWAALEAIQRRFTNQITEVKSLDYWSRLKKLRLYSSQRRTERYQLIYLWKIMEGLAPNLKSNKVITKFSERRGRYCVIPTLKTRSCSAKISTIRENSFAIHTPTVFNSLPKKLRDITGVTVETFKHHLDRCLSNIPDQPSVSGYSGQRAAATNSIIHQIKHIGGGTCGADL